MIRFPFRVVLCVTMIIGCTGRDGGGDPPPPPFEEPSGPRVVVEVLNASGLRGLARAGTFQLRRQGIDVVSYGTADTAVDSTVILLRRGKMEAALRVARALGTGRIRLERDTLRRVDVTVLLGPDFRAPTHRP